jgi:hypothetical protein
MAIAWVFLEQMVRHALPGFVELDARFDHVPVWYTYLV